AGCAGTTGPTARSSCAPRPGAPAAPRPGPRCPGWPGPSRAGGRRTPRGRWCRPGPRPAGWPRVPPGPVGEGAPGPVDHAVGDVGGDDVAAQRVLAQLAAEPVAQLGRHVALQVVGEVVVLGHVGGD